MNNIQRVLVCIIGIIILIIVGIIGKIFIMTINGPIDDHDLYTVVFHNNTEEIIGHIKIYLSMGDDKVFYCEENDINPKEYRKINININSEKLSNIQSKSYNVDIECISEDLKIAESPIGYFTSEFGGFNVVELSKNNAEYVIQIKDDEKDRGYKQLRKRHYKNLYEMSWHD